MDEPGMNEIVRLAGIGFVAGIGIALAIAGIVEVMMAFAARGKFRHF